MSRIVRWSRSSVMAILVCSFSSTTLAEVSETLEVNRSAAPPTPMLSGTLSMAFDEAKLWSLGIEITPVGDHEFAQNKSMIEFSFDVIEPNHEDGVPLISAARFAAASGAIMLERGGLREIVSAIVLTYSSDGSIQINSAVQSQDDEGTLALSDAAWFSNDLGEQQLSGDIVLTSSAMEHFGIPSSSKIIVGYLDLSPELYESDEQLANLSAEKTEGSFATNNQSLNQGGALVPDVIVGDLHQLNNYGTAGGISAFSVGTVSCNIGTAPLNWFFNVNQHPVIGQNMYRYKGGQFEQIGMSWLKHGFFALSEDLCNPGKCNGDPTGEHLGPGCSDPYSANLNGSQGNLGPRSEVDAFTGNYAFPFGGAAVNSLISRRLQVDNDDLSPTLNVGAQYFVEGQYVTPDDAMAGNGFNNASYREINVSESGGNFSINFAGNDTVRKFPAIHAWRDIDPQVQISRFTVPSEGTFTLGARVTDLGNGTWHYEYALHNLNSHRSAQSFSVPLFPGITLTNIGFHDVPYHSGEPYAQTPWQVQVTNDAITWSTDDFGVDPDANALRWATMYNFRFDANFQSDQQSATVGLFRPGSPGSVTVSAPAPTDQLVSAAMVLPPFDNTKDRYITIDSSTNAGQLVAIRVSRNNGTEVAYASCNIEDFGAEGFYSTLVASPEFCVWNTQVLHISGCMIAPGNTYSVENTLDDVAFSAPLIISTTDVPFPREFGDIVGAFVVNAWSGPDGIVSSADIVAVVQGFQLMSTAASIARLDAVPSSPNRILAANDILAIVLAFAGEPYQFGLSCSTGTCEPDCSLP